jgi:glycosyltransferase involved in cell wall biosynthesis
LPTVKSRQNGEKLHNLVTLLKSEKIVFVRKSDLQNVFAARIFSTVVVTARVARWYIFKPKKPNLGKFLRVLQWKILVYFMDIWSIFRPFRIYFMALWYILSSFGIFSPFWFFVPKQSGNPGHGSLDNSQEQIV